jgi:CRP/FNR family transcriptional regulator, nitrogen oxide reductase regulator
MEIPAEKIIESLQEIPLFKNLQKEALPGIWGDGKLFTVEKGKTIFFQEDPAEKFYVLLKGRIKLSKLTVGGNIVTMHYSGPGEAIGVIAVLREIDYPVSAETVEDCELISWDRITMRNWLQAEPQIAINSIRILSNFINIFQDRITELSTERVGRRIARTLLRLAKQTGIKEENGIRINMRLTRKDIADMAGTTLFTVSRTLSGWETDGLIDCSQPQIILTSPHLMVNIADDLKA